MKTVAIFALLVAATSSQVSVAPLFPLGAAIPDIVLVLLVAVTFFGGPRAAMAAIPFAALFLGFQSGREPGLLLLGYLPLLPLSAWLAAVRIPLTGAGRFVAAGAATGVTVRGVLTIGAIINGASASATTIVFHLILPGLFLDVALLATVYTACRLVRWGPLDLTLQRRATYR